uniref:Isochorismatase-like domain-containing protein n=1 Tax=Chromera velia CCMP2878 TaxID=1169474 RepID=A0A0G4HQD9_9ALVE|eukprot:Cvel_30235.t1-p1 / transcript=Cvel_30235.t1 / gene=Cvel_30235 / organism=Chromera_velia_CCMP2878 / gene_product=Maleamate amidohydrolase, putative / transcript_product=Maleamate amidohydrolase, putative / location=Cvel_scaffold4284:747-1772(-) / protein_length=342 / sequence_SO=supercontig / SO=protein_coding / is_pseudo=false
MTHAVFQTDFTPSQGNALQACVATIFGCGLDSVPNFIAMPGGYAKSLNDWLSRRDLCFLKVKLQDDKLPFPADFPSPTPVLLAGKSPRGDHKHVVVAEIGGGKPAATITHDPFPDGGGLESPLDWVGVFLPTSNSNSLSHKWHCAIPPRSPPSVEWVQRPVAVLLVDMQVDFFQKSEPVSTSFPRLPDAVASLLTAARRSGAEVVHVRERSNSVDSPWFAFWKEMNPGRDPTVTPEAEAFAREEKNERVFAKSTYDAFLDTGLDTYLRSRGIRTLLIGGLVTSACVLLAASGAFQRGYRPLVVEDCCGDRSVDLHRQTLSAEDRRSFGVVDLAFALSVLEES